MVTQMTRFCGLIISQLFFFLDEDCLPIAWPFSFFCRVLQPTSRWQTNSCPANTSEYTTWIQLAMHRPRIKPKTFCKRSIAWHFNGGWAKKTNGGVKQWFQFIIKIFFFYGLHLQNDGVLCFQWWTLHSRKLTWNLKMMVSNRGCISFCLPYILWNGHPVHSLMAALVSRGFVYPTSEKRWSGDWWHVFPSPFATTDLRFFLEKNMQFRNLNPKSWRWDVFSWPFPTGDVKNCTCWISCWYMGVSKNNGKNTPNHPF